MCLGLKYVVYHAELVEGSLAHERISAFGGALFDPAIVLTSMHQARLYSTMTNSAISITIVSPKSTTPNRPLSSSASSSNRWMPSSAHSSFSSIMASRDSFSAPIKVPKWMPGT